MHHAKENFLFANLAVAVICAVACVSYGLLFATGCMVRIVVGPILEERAQTGGGADAVSPMVYGMMGMTAAGVLLMVVGGLVAMYLSREHAAAKRAG